MEMNSEALSVVHSIAHPVPRSSSDVDTGAASLRRLGGIDFLPEEEVRIWKLTYVGKRPPAISTDGGAVTCHWKFWQNGS